MKRILFAVAMFLSGNSVIAQDSTSLDEVIVTANKLEQKQSSTGKVISVIDQVTLRNNSGKLISEILNYESGIFISGANNTPGTNQDIYFRGAGTGKVLILIDGIPQTDPSQINNTFDINTIPLQRIERIEILKGAQSTLYGSDALAGVINIITKKAGSKKINVNALASYGSYETFRGGLGIDGIVNKLSYNLGYQYTNSNGFSAAIDSLDSGSFDDDGIKQHSFLGNIGYAISPFLTASITSNFGIYEAGIDAGAFADDADNIFTTRNNNNGVGLSFKKKKIDIKATYNHIYARRNYLDDSSSVGGFSKFQKSFYKGTSNVGEVYSNYKISPVVSLLGGIQYITQKTTQQYFSLSSFGPYETALGDSASINNTAIYLSGVVSEFKKLSLEAGIRYNNHNIYGSNATFSFNPSYAVDEATRVFVNISSGFKAPTLYQLFSEFGNKNLVPEKSMNYEMGIQSFTNNKRNSLRLVAFKRDIENVFSFYTDPITFAGQYINSDEQNDYGFEGESIIGFGRFNSWKNNFTYVDGVGSENGVKTRNLFRRPNFTFNSAVSVQFFNSLTLIPSFRFIGTRSKGIFDPGPKVLPQYCLLNALATWKLKKRFSFLFDFQNITDQKYVDIPGFSTRGKNASIGFSLLGL